MSKNDIPPRITPSAVPDRLRNDGWWLTETCRPQRAPFEEVSISMLIVIEGRHLREDQQWTLPTA
ncbi:hypothetical protein ELI49_33580 [Rhizobium ruizarguesonis]|jgi:hypothetical protein|nr:hypothetical protein [Rhizobium leguminosarum bv. viciae]TAT97461.1 hypothetical protein ELI49_33580 [Rhizobium ruizarguesonis]TAW03236.1 hypothetical protein ELI25_36235 [Rhizobium ruizarguesonis]TAZ44090.1 hypothetical protein ELH76_36380 [Rhizobium ruizarguesonis]TBC26093.1 hypothetical protein ELH33_30795 [Rhizobium ruizarguesonis]